MYPLKVALVVGAKPLWEEIQPVLNPLPFRIVFEQSEVGDWAEFLTKLERLRPDVILFDISKCGSELEEQLRRLRSVANAPAIFAVDASAEPEKILRSIRAGAAEFLYPPLAASLNTAIIKLADEKGKQSLEGRTGGRVAAFLSVKGGCGATTIACHTAVELAALISQKVLLADLDLESGLISFLMKSTTQYSVLDAVNNLHRLDQNFWKALVSNGRPGVEVVGSAMTPNLRESPQADQIREVLRFMRTQYGGVLLDMGRGLTRFSLGTLEHVDMTFLVTTLEIPALHQAQHLVRALLTSGYPKDRLHLVLNRVPKNPEVTIGELESMLGVPISLTIPNDYPALYECYAEGKLLPTGNRLSKRIGDVAAKIGGVEPSKEKKKFSLFG